MIAARTNSGLKHCKHPTESTDNEHSHPLSARRKGFISVVTPALRQ